MQQTDTPRDTELVNVAQLRLWLESFAEEVADNRDLLTQLDSAIGDADHGSNLDRGMSAVVVAIENAQPGSPADLFKLTGMTLVGTVGGASGPLYGTFFLRMSTSAPATSTSVEAPAMGEMLRAGLGGIVARGRAEAGDKTMYDALAPACDAYDAAVREGAGMSEALVAAAQAAAAGRDSTLDMLARKGRASYLGERSVGHIDPGAASMTMLIESAARALG
jgi:dihydroxyacetone kinase-like protein